MKGDIEIVDYDSRWPQQFQELKAVYNSVLGDLIISIEHVGSTAVAGLEAKPIIDIDIVVADERQLNKIIPSVALLGYQFRGDLGIKDRYAFRRVSELSPDNGNGVVWPDHHLYCCLEGSLSLNNHLLFRDALRAAPILAKQYGDLKKKLALMTDDMDVYVESKSSFIAEVLYQAGISSIQIEDIVAQNKGNGKKPR
jgi:GrpB-like predicted nucleotidyltransferase (UPF0157 family)